MKIGVDASCWMNKRGYGRYTRELLRSMLTLDREHEYWLFLDSKTARESEDLPEAQRVKHIIIETSQAAARAASAAGSRSLKDIWSMARSVHQHGARLFLDERFAYLRINLCEGQVSALKSRSEKTLQDCVQPGW